MLRMLIIQLMVNTDCTLTTEEISSLFPDKILLDREAKTTSGYEELHTSACIVKEP